MVQGIADANWWFVEFTEPTMMILARTASIQALVSDEAPVAWARDPGVMDHSETSFQTRGSGNHGTCPGPAKAKKARKQDLAKISDGRFTHNRTGTKICAAFQTGAPPNLVQKGAITSVGHACRLKTRLLASLPAAALPATAAAPAAARGGGGGPTLQGQAQSLCSTS